MHVPILSPVQSWYFVISVIVTAGNEGADGHAAYEVAPSIVKMTGCEALPI